jgi:hypothetical protein
MTVELVKNIQIDSGRSYPLEIPETAEWRVQPPKLGWIVAVPLIPIYDQDYEE